MTKDTDTTEHTPYQLARMADCMDPDGPDSPGAQWLLLIESDAAHRYGWDQEHNVESCYGADEYRYDVTHELADSVVPIYTGHLWSVFVDVGAYAEEVTEYGQIEDLDTAARVALYMIAERLYLALFTEYVESASETDNRKDTD